MIVTALSPNLQRDDLWLSLRLLLQPWKWQRGAAQLELRTALQNYFSTQNIWPVNSGRTALLTVLQSLNLQVDDEVLMQAFTCNAVCNPISWAGAKPVYVDIDAATLNMSASDLEKKISPRAKVLIIQHTFGQPANLTPLLALAKQHNLIVIEDCAHALGARYQNELVGTFGDAAIYSFGRDKVISSVYGGALLVNNPRLVAGVQERLAALPLPQRRWTAQQLVHPLITTLSRYLPGLLSLAQRLGWISLAVSRAERKAQQPHYFPAALPNGLAKLAAHQLNKLDQFNAHRQGIAHIYHRLLKTELAWSDDAIWLRYSLLVRDPHQVFAQAKQAGMILGDWYWSAIVPGGGNLEQYGYVPGNCPVAEETAQHIINLPTHINLTTQQAEKIAKLMQTWR